MKQRSRWLVATLIIITAACGSAGDAGSQPATASDGSGAEVTDVTSASPRSSGDLVFGIDASTTPPGVTSAVGFDPILAGDEFTSVLADALWDSLTVIDGDGHAQPSVARSWSTEDQRVWVFHLDPEARYHDGTPVVAADFAWAVSRLSQHPEVTLHYLGEPIAGWGSDAPALRAIDEQTLEITTVEPFPLLPQVVANVVFSPRPASSAGEPTPPQNGPYRLISQAGVTIEAERFGGRGEESVGPDRLITRAFDGQPALAAGINSGEVDITPLNPSLIAELGLPAERVTGGGAPVISFLDFNLTRHPMDDVHVRKALSLAIDRASLLHLDGPDAAVATGWAPPGWEGAAPAACTSCVVDAGAARAELAASGLDPSAVSITLASFQDPRAEEIARMWREVLGINVVVDRSGSDPTQADVMLAGWFPDYPATGSYLAAALARLYGPPTPATVELIQTALSEADPASRREALDAAQAALGDELISAPLSFTRAPWYMGSRVKKLPFDAMAMPALYSVELTD